MANIFEYPIFKEFILPFLLIFVLVFAILQRTKLLGEDKKQVDALVALAVGLIFIAIQPAKDFVIAFLPWIGVGIAVIFVFLVLYGFVAGDLSGDKIPNWMKVVFGILSGLFVIGIILWITGWYKLITAIDWNSSFWINVILIVVIVATIIIVLKGVGGKSEKKE
jgi:hypothetical protein